MKIKKTISQSARSHPLYLAAFGKASEEERCSKCCSRSAKVLKLARRKLYNELLETRRGFERLQGLVRRSPSYSSKLTLNSKKISEACDDEYEGYNPRKPLFHMTPWDEMDTDMDRDSTSSGFTLWKDPDLSENDACSMSSSNTKKATGKGPFDRPSQPILILPIYKRRKLKFEADDDDDDIYHYASDEEMEKLEVKNEDGESCDYYEDEVEHTSPYQDSDSDSDDEDLGRLKPKWVPKAYSNSYKAPTAGDDDDDDMFFSDTWSNEATIADSDNEGSTLSDAGDNLEGVQ